MPKAPAYDPWLPNEVVIPEYELLYIPNPYTKKAFVSFMTRLTQAEQFGMLKLVQGLVKIAIDQGISYAKTHDDRLR